MKHFLRFLNRIAKAEVVKAEAEAMAAKVAADEAARKAARENHEAQEALLVVTALKDSGRLISSITEFTGGCDRGAWHPTKIWSLDGQQIAHWTL
ncbi:MAG: hypothetical protein WC107_04270 [Patescibacteria group bacterium]